MSEHSLLSSMQRTVESRWFQGVVLTLIIVNAIALGLETFDPIERAYGPVLAILDRTIVFAFVGEIAMRIAVYRASFFKNGWNLFDFFIVGISLLASTSGLAALRAFRVLRVLRLIAVMPRMRTVVNALLDAIPGIASVGVILAIIVYVFAVIASTLYGDAHPEMFGNVVNAMATLSQVMTLEGWPDIAGAVAKTHGQSWIFFLAFMLIATFTMMNLFIAIVVRVIEDDAEAIEMNVVQNQDDIRREIADLKQNVSEIKQLLTDLSK